MDFKSGFISIIGRPNVGKSTLLNRLVGEKVAIISSKPQTTRNTVLGIKTTENCQMVFLDTPGIHSPKNKLGEFMVNSAFDSLNDVDSVLFVVEPADEILPAEEKIMESLRGREVILVVNKIDSVLKEKLLSVIEMYSSKMEFKSVVLISALKNDGVDTLVSEILKLMPNGPMYFPEDEITDQPERQITSEIIREKALRLLQKEIPHGIAVAIDEMKDTENRTTKISATIFCEKESHKAIIIGKNGEMLKKIGTSARKDIERLVGCKVFLTLWVKVKSGWRNSDVMIKNFGYDAKN